MTPRLKWSYRSVRAFGAGLAAALISLAVPARAQSQRDFSLAPFGERNYFIDQCKFFRTDIELRQGRPLDFGVTDEDFQSLRQQVWDGIIAGAIPYSPGKDASYFGKSIASAVDNFCSSRAPGGTKLLKQWICAEAVVAWVSWNVKYDVAKVDPFKDGNWTLNAPPNVLQRPLPWAQCCGYSMLTRDIAREAGAKYGLECEYVGGWFRGLINGEKAPIESNHAWNIFKFDDGVLVPADSTLCSTILRGSGGTSRRSALPYCLPVKNVEWEVFMASHWGDVYPNSSTDIRGIDFSRVTLGKLDALSTLSLQQWKRVDTKPWIPILKAIQN